MNNHRHAPPPPVINRYTQAELRFEAERECKEAQRENTELRDKILQLEMEKEMSQEAQRLWEQEAED